MEISYKIGRFYLVHPDCFDCLIIFYVQIIDGVPSQEFIYVAKKEELSEVGAILWEQVKNKVNGNMSNIPLMPERKLPEIEPPSEDVLRIKALNQVDEQLSILNGIRFIARGQIDPEFEKLRLQSIEDWLAVENQPNFPFDYDLPEIWNTMSITHRLREAQLETDNIGKKNELS